MNDLILIGHGCTFTKQKNSTVVQLTMAAFAEERRDTLLAFLRISVLTLARPDAAHEVSTDAARGQWDTARHVLNLNPRSRPQTRKYRAAVPIARQAAWLLDECDGPFVKANSVKKAFHAMANELGLPGEGEAGMKLIRRSMASLLRVKTVPAEEIELMLGHRRLDSVSDLYAPFDPDYLAGARAAIETIIDEVEAPAPGAFHRGLTAGP